MDRIKELEAENARLTAQLAAIQGGMGEEVEERGLQWLDTGHYRKKPPQFGYNPHDWNPLMTVAQHQRITAAMAAEAERLKAEVTRWHTLACNHSRAEDQLRAELAEVKGREAVATIEQREPYEDGTPNPCKTLCWVGDNAEDDFPAGTKLYTTPPASPDVEGLVKALEKIAFRAECFAEEERDMPPHSCEVVAGIAEDALSAWRQAHTPSTLPASSAEE